MVLPLKILFFIKRDSKFFLLAGLLLTGISTLFSQTLNPVAEKLAEQMNELAKNNAPELIYIQPSKGIYETCEDLWFKAYLLDAQYFTPSLLSKTLYIQLINESTRKSVWQGKYEINNGFADGHVFLQDSLPDGNYLLTAFTQHSFFANSEELKAVRRIKICKEIKTLSVSVSNAIQQSNKKNSIQFTTFPESGNLVAGIRSKLAFKAVGIDGLSVEVEGVLLEDSLPVVKFKSSHAGMGSLIFTPLAGKKYRIRLSKSVADTVFSLPQVMPQGITLQLVKRDKEFLEFRVSQSKSLPQRTIYLRAQVRGVVCCLATGVLNSELKIKIPLKEFPYQGIAEFTLFDQELLPVAERLVYVNPEKKLTVEAHLDKDRYQTREKVILKIKVTDENEQPVVANLGVNVYDKLYRNADDPENILTHCHLNSQLRGKIYNPAFYFDTKNPDREESLDLLLLTQGWRRYVWGQEALHTNSNKNQSVVFDGIRGEVHATKHTKQIKGIQQFIMASNPGKNNLSDMIMSDSTGQFTVAPKQLKMFPGEYVYLKPLAPEEFKHRISIVEPFVAINEIAKIKEINYPLPLIVVKKSDDTNKPLVEGHGSIKLAEVTVKAHGIVTFRDKYIGHLDSLAKFDLCPDYVGKLCHMLNCPVCGTGSKPIEGKKYGEWVSDRYPAEGRHPFVFYAGEKKEIVYHYPKFTEEELLARNNLSRIKAYEIRRELYEPKYDNADSLNDPLPDYRNTLLWKPMIVTDEKGEASLEFFCSDINTHFVGNIEGLNGEGLLGTTGFEFSVYNPKLSK
jgi:hypothetical protein